MRSALYGISLQNAEPGFVHSTTQSLKHHRTFYKLLAPNSPSISPQFRSSLCVHSKRFNSEFNPSSEKGMSQAEYDAQWEKYWSDGLPEGVEWDLAGPHKALVSMLEQNQIDVKGKRTLVPGCGRGYDAITFAKNGAIVDGLEIAVSAVAEAKSYLERFNTTHGSNVDVNYHHGNFFEHEGEYEVGFDYTFFCAIHPDERPKWGRKWAELIKPGGTLLLFLFPTKPFRPEGPPWPVTSKDATSVLQEFFTSVVDEENPLELTPGQRRGFETKMIWTRN